MLPPRIGGPNAGSECKGPSGVQGDNMRFDLRASGLLQARVNGECVALAAQLDQLTFRDALHVAAAAGRAATVRALLDSGAWEAEATNGIGETPRQMAAERGHAEVAELLAGRGAR